MITRDEEKAIGTVIKEIKHIVPAAEILIVDSSKDKTPQIAKKNGVKVIRQFPPKGYGPAMEKALMSAAGEVIVTLDCDRTYPTKMIPIMINLVVKKGYDLVDGSRLNSKPEAMPLLNFLANRVFALLATLLFFHWLTDLHSGMRAYRQSMIRTMHFDAKGSALPVELLLKPIKRGYKIKIISIDYFPRVGDSKMSPLSGAWWTIKRIFTVRFN